MYVAAGQDLHTDGLVLVEEELVPYIFASQRSHDVLPAVLDHPAGQATHECFPLSNVPGSQARVELQTPSSSQSTAVHPWAMATEEDPPAAM